MDFLRELIPVMSLAIAVLTVFVGPFVSWFVVAKRSKVSLAIASKQITAPMRQAWVNTLRDQLAELASAAEHYAEAGFQNRKDEEYQRLTLLLHKVRLMLNPEEADHMLLDEAMREMIGALNMGLVAEGDEFGVAHWKVIDLSRQVLKREWNRVGQDIQIS